jgi:uncharacterized protein (TIRG00374 family)
MGFAQRDTLIMIGLFVLMVFGLVALALTTGWAETRDAIARITPPQILILLSLSLVNYLLRGLRWHLFAVQLGLGTSLLQNLRHFIGGFAMLVTPGRVGELVRMRWIRRETGWTFERTAPLVLMDRALDLVAISLVLSVAVVMTAGGVGGALPVVAVALVLAYAVTHPKLLEVAATLAYRLTGRFARVFVKLRRASKSLVAFRSPPMLVAAVIIGSIGWFVEGLALYLLLDWLDAGVSLWMATGIFLISTLAGGLTGAPGGVGGAEAAMVALLTLQGVPLTLSVPATLVIRITTLWFAILIGFMTFPLAERMSQKGAYANA